MFHAVSFLGWMQGRRQESVSQATTQLSQHCHSGESQLAGHSCHLPELAITERECHGAVGGASVQYEHKVPCVLGKYEYQINTHMLANLYKLPMGVRYIWQMPRPYFFLLFADPCQVLVEKVSPKKYESREPGCVFAWCEAMRFCLQRVQNKHEFKVVISLSDYMYFNYLLTQNVDRLLTGHTPGTIRASAVFFGSKIKQHTDMGIVETIEYKQKCERKYKHCRGTRSESFKILREDGFVTDSDHRLLNGIKNYSVRSGFTIEDKIIQFHCLAPSSRKKEDADSPCDVLFKNELGALSESFFDKLNKKLMTVCKSKKEGDARLDALLDILSKAIHRLQQLHIPMDGTGRTNLLLIHYLLAYFDFPPVMLMDPNATSILHKKRCKKNIVCRYS